MAGTMRKMGVYLGLLEDGAYDEDYLDEQDVAPARERQRPAPREAVYREPAMAGAMPPRGEAETTGEVARLDDRRRAQAAQAAAAQSMVAVPERRETAAPVGAPATRVAPLSRIVTLHPRTYNEARVIGENFRDGVPVIMNLSEMDDDDAKRLVDFAAGLIFGVRGSIERVTNKVFLLSPPNVSVAAEDKQRIAEGGFFNQS